MFALAQSVSTTPKKLNFFDATEENGKLNRLACVEMAILCRRGLRNRQVRGPSNKYIIRLAYVKISAREIRERENVSKL